MPITKELFNALQYLDKQILAAELLMANTPGSVHTKISLGGEKSLVFDCSEFRIKSDDSSTPLNEIKVEERVKATQKIPDFLTRAMLSQSEITEAAVEAADRIEQSLANLEGEGK